jgi:hypothetical protein
VGVPPRCGRRRPRPARRGVAGARSHSGAPARRPGPFVHRRRGARHRLYRRLVTAARILAGGWITGAVHAGGFLSPDGISARHANGDADPGADRLHPTRGAGSARERRPSHAEPGRHRASLLPADDGRHRSIGPWYCPEAEDRGLGTPPGAGAFALGQRPARQAGVEFRAAGPRRRAETDGAGTANLLKRGRAGHTGLGCCHL